MEQLNLAGLPRRLGPNADTHVARGGAYRANAPGHFTDCPLNSSIAARAPSWDRLPCCIGTVGPAANACQVCGGRERRSAPNKGRENSDRIRFKQRTPYGRYVPACGAMVRDLICNRLLLRPRSGAQDG